MLNIFVGVKHEYKGIALLMQEMLGIKPLIR